jgi:glycosyltransferase involved in cell wall biosynthesis
MNVSVIVPTYNGEKKILTLLNALKTQTFREFEIVVVIDGSTDNTLEVVNDFGKGFQKLKVIVQDNQGRAVVKNRGVMESSGKFLIFYDDDMEPDSNSVQLHISFYEKTKGLLTGNLIESVHENTDIQRYKASLAEKWLQKYNEGLNELSVSDLFFSAANCSVPRDQFLSLGGFDERLKDAEDYDFALRAINSGIKVYFDKSNCAIHHERITCKSYIMRLREYNRARQKVNTLHPELKPFKDPIINAGKRVIYAFFSLPIFWKLVDNFNMLILLPKRTRYKIYDVIVFALSNVYPDAAL